MSVFAPTEALRITQEFGTADCHIFRGRIFANHPSIAIDLAHHYRRIARNKGHAAANTALRELNEGLRLGKAFHGLFLSASDDEVKRFAKKKAMEVSRTFWQKQKSRGGLAGLDEVLAVLDKCDLAFPLADPYRATKKKLGTALARIFDAAWWIRQIRKRQDFILEKVQIELGRVNKHKGIYASEHCLRRKLKQWANNEEVLASLVAENDLGQVFNLLELTKKSISNLKIRRNELMTRLSGFEELSKNRGDIGIFVTLTAPSKYHSYLSTPCIPNPKYGGFTPADAHAYFNGQWAKMRAKFDRAGIKLYGFRVAEPHHDGCPHWHLLLFLPPNQLRQLKTIIRHYALEIDGDEPGARKRRTKFEHIDPKKGSATGYIAKYIAKNIDGANVGEDLYGKDAIDSATRIRAWASNWKIRQFQQLGGASVTAWRECRRLAFSDLKEAVLSSVTDDKLVELVNAADGGNWARFVELMGGPTSARKDQALRALHVVKDKLTRYGEEAKKIVGLLYHGVKKLKTRFADFIIRPMTLAEKAFGLTEADFSSGGANAPPLEFCQ